MVHAPRPGRLDGAADPDYSTGCRKRLQVRLAYVSGTKWPGKSVQYGGVSHSYWSAGTSVPCPNEKKSITLAHYAASTTVLEKNNFV